MLTTLAVCILMAIGLAMSACSIAMFWCLLRIHDVGDEEHEMRFSNDESRDRLELSLAELEYSEQGAA